MGIGIGGKYTGSRLNTHQESVDLLAEIGIYRHFH